MIYQNELIDPGCVAVWIAEFDEDELDGYLGWQFEEDFGVLLEPGLGPVTAVSDSPLPIQQLLWMMKGSIDWFEEASDLAAKMGISKGRSAFAFPHLRYPPELAQTHFSKAAFPRFIGNINWTSGLAEWNHADRAIIDRPPFPRLLRDPFIATGEGLRFRWKGIVHLESWTDFATPEDFKSWLAYHEVQGDLNLYVNVPDDDLLRAPTGPQAAALIHLIQNESVVLEMILAGILAARSEWEISYHEMTEGTDLPEIARPNELLKQFRPPTIKILDHDIDGVAPILFEFPCRWNFIMPLHVTIHKDRILEIKHRLRH